MTWTLLWGNSHNDLLLDQVNRKCATFPVGTSKENSSIVQVSRMCTNLVGTPKSLSLRQVDADNSIIDSKEEYVVGSDINLSSSDVRTCDVCSNDSNSVSDEFEDALKFRGKTMLLFFANITTFGRIAKSFILREKTDKYSVIMMAEHHMSKTFDVTNPMSSRHFDTACNPAESTDRSVSGTHGGESVSMRKHLRTIPIDKKVIHNLDFFVPVRFTCKLGLQRLVCTSSILGLFEW